MVENKTPLNATESKLRSLAMACHLLALVGFIVPFGNILGPLIFWLIKKDQSPLIDENGKESLNFQISMSIYTLVSIVLMFIFIGILFLIALAVTNIVLVILAAVKVNNGESFRYPLTLRFIK